VTSGDIAQRILGLEITGSHAGWEKLARDLVREVEIRDRKLDELRAALQGRERAPWGEDVKKKSMKMPTQKEMLEKYKRVLVSIAEPIGIKEDARDYRSIALRMQSSAKLVLAEKCPCCGQVVNP